MIWRPMLSREICFVFLALWYICLLYTSIFTVYITNLIQQSNKRRKQYYEEEEQQKKASAQKESAEKAVVQKVNT